MMNQDNSERITRLRVTLATMIFALTLLSLPIGNKAKANLNVAPPPADKCVTRAFIEVKKVQYQGKDSGDDKVYVEWRDAGASPCVYFGGGFDVPGQSGQANAAAGNTTTTIPLSGTPGSVASFEIVVTATAGSVIEKTVTSSGLF